MDRKKEKKHVFDVFTSMPLNGKIMVIIIAGILVPLIVISFIVFGTIYKNTMETEYRLRKINLANAVSSTEELLDDYEDAVEKIYDYEAFFKTAASTERIGADTVNVDGSVNVMLAQIRRSREFFAGVSFVFPDESIISQTSGYGRFEEIASDNRQNLEMIMIQMYDSTQAVSWQVSLPAGKERDSKSAFFSGRKIIRNIYDKNELTGIVVAHISSLALNKLTALSGYQDGSVLAILDASYQLVWSNESADTVIQMLDENEGHLLKYSETKLNEYENHYFLCQHSEKLGWYFINVIPQEDVNQQALTFIWFLAIVIGLIIFFCILCMILVRRSIVHPIRKMIVVMDEVDELGKIRVKLPTNQSDEIGCLYKTYNRLNERIDLLVSQLMSALQQDKEKEIKLLHSQLNPHFIYNTLESISWVAYEHQVPEISKVVNCLSEILKYSIKFSDEYVTFGKELEMLKNYIYIQHFRFEDKFEVYYDIDEDLLKYKTIKFTFQPFVENALVHGFKDRTQDCRIDIRLYRDADDIVAAIEDNGCGMDEILIHQVTRMHTKGIGIGNINKALQLRFGGGYRIEIQSVPEIGTKIYIRVPEIKS